MSMWDDPLWWDRLCMHAMLAGAKEPEKPSITRFEDIKDKPLQGRRAELVIIDDVTDGPDSFSVDQWPRQAGKTNLLFNLMQKRLAEEQSPDHIFVGMDFATLRDDIGDDMLDATEYCFKGTMSGPKHSHQIPKEKPMETSKWTPVEIETFLQIYYRTNMTYYQLPQSKQKACVALASQQLVRINEATVGQYRLTQKGHAFLQLLLNTPIPKKQQRWVDPRTDEILIEEQ